MNRALLNKLHHMLHNKLACNHKLRYKPHNKLRCNHKLHNKLHNKPIADLKLIEVLCFRDTRRYSHRATRWLHVVRHEKFIFIEAPNPHEEPRRGIYVGFGVVAWGRGVAHRVSHVCRVAHVHDATRHTCATYTSCVTCSRTHHVSHATYVSYAHDV